MSCILVENGVVIDDLLEPGSPLAHDVVRDRGREATRKCSEQIDVGVGFVEVGEHNVRPGRHRDVISVALLMFKKV